jgi:hypothetical protein
VHQLPHRGRQNLHRRIPLVVRWPGNLKNLGRPAPAMRNFSVGLCLTDGRENLVVESLGSSAGAGVENLTPLRITTNRSCRRPPPARGWRSRCRNPHGGPTEPGCPARHPAGRRPPARRPHVARRPALQNDQGLVRHPRDPELALRRGDDECAFILLGVCFRGRVVSINYLVSVSSLVVRHFLLVIYRRRSRTAALNPWARRSSLRGQEWLRSIIILSASRGAPYRDLAHAVTHRLTCH